jgi:LL-diaminopimelate aminotransferase
MNHKDTFLPPAHRISSFEPYFFASLGNRISQLKQKGVDVIRIDMGSPDLPPATFIIDELVEKSRRSDTHGYSPTGGTQEFKKAVAQYYLDRFEVNLDPQTEVIGLIGSKEGLFNLSQVILNPGDIALVPDPGYPVYSASGIIAGGKVVNFPLLEENHFLPDLEAIPADILKDAKILWLNYPNNPTGAIASLSFF